jgi:hypothetical protein
MSIDMHKYQILEAEEMRKAIIAAKHKRDQDLTDLEREFYGEPETFKSEIRIAQETKDIYQAYIDLLGKSIPRDICQCD